MIHLERVTRRFGALTAVKDLTLEIGKGEIFGLVGPDGAGKTTTLRLLCGLLDPTEGQVRVSGLDVGRNLDQVKDRIGYMAQKFGLYGDLSVDENLEFYSDLFGVTKQERDSLMGELLEMTRMAPFRDRAAAKLSGGMKQKLALMCTLLHRPEVLFLDEPTNGVDPLSRRDFWEILYRLTKEGMTILVTTAYLDEAERCGRVGLMHQGRLVRCDTPAALKEALRPFCFSVEAPDLRAARAALNTRPEVVAAEPAGSALHVYLREGADASALREGKLSPVEPSMEDVFIAVVRKEERDAA